MPILEAHHDLAHPVEGDSAWSESYYFNAYDPRTDSGFFARIGIRPNEGTMDAALSAWLPGGDVAEFRSVTAQRAMVDSVLAVGGVRFEMLVPLQSWRLTLDADAPVRPCVPGAAVARTAHLAVDVRFDAATPAIGTDGQPSGATAATGPKTAEAAASAATVGKGHFEQAGGWTGWLEVDGVRHHWEGAHGNRDKSWGPRRWGGPRMWRWFSINVADGNVPDGNIASGMHFGGIRLGTEAGDLHRGWVWDGEKAASIAEWRVRTELEDDAVTQRVVHLEVVDKMRRTFSLRGDVLRVAGTGKAGGTLVNEGLARWTYLNPDGPERTGYGICEYLHQLDGSGRPVVPVA
jgi:hypothetical protein